MFQYGILTLLFVSLFVTVRCTELSSVTDIEALKVFKDSITHDPFGALANWIDANHYRNWSGITCDSSYHVISISLLAKELQGKISPFLGNISSLQVLDLSSNSFTESIPSQLGFCSKLTQLIFFNNSLSGTIPKELGNLRNLQVLDFGNNLLNGDIPENVCGCTTLTALGFNTNNFSGTIPSCIGNLVNLQVFVAYTNNLRGSIPVSIGRLSALQTLDLSENQFSGKLPSGIGNLTNLQYLSFWGNILSGEIPPEIGHCHKLVELDLYSNALNGSIPSQLGELVNIEVLRLFDNHLSSTIPASISQCKSLIHLGLSRNELTGTIPSELGSLASLQVLTLFSNNLMGKIPLSLMNLQNLSYLHLGMNSLGGEIPSNIGSLYKLEKLFLYGNLLEGPIPSEIGNLSLLVTLQLGLNRLSGSIPPTMSKLSLLQGLTLFGNNLEGAITEQIFELKQLTVLDLSLNSFTGPIPDAFSNFQFLSVLNLHGNMLNGSIPRGMDQLDHLTLLDLSNNHLTGSIPESVIAGMKSMSIYLNLSHNYLVGSIPVELGEYQMVQAIDISNNNLSGNIPSALGGCQSLFSLNLSRNALSGQIPAEFLSQLGSLSYLNLSCNYLDGELPGNIGDLKHLNILDLSRNKLNGTIPENFGNLSALTYLNLSFNKLEGPVPKAGIFRHLDASNLEGNPGLCGTNFLTPCRNSSNLHTPHRFSKKAALILIVLGAIVICLILISATFILHQCIKNRKSKDIEPLDACNYLSPTIKRFDPRELEIATCFFSEENVIGSSAMSTVFKGNLENGQIVAVKTLNLQRFSSESDKCFKREVESLSHLKHRNLVKVIGFAWASGKLKALVLKYMENGSLENIIHDPGLDRSRWTLSERMNVCVSVSHGLDYLHSGFDFPIVHCDLKPSNILLDGDWEAHVSDFGTARMLGVHPYAEVSLSTTSAFEGTIGYLAPEFAYMRKVTTKADVFSFGIVIMELLTGKRPTGTIEENGLPITLCQFVELALEEGINKLLHVVDPDLASSISTKQEQEKLVKLFKLALSCTCPAPEERPNMNEVLSSLCKISQSITGSSS
ncbi:LRR receptor-like serine/threonine-protein kinase FLS2 [Telopea speciosissima]|uniref:LRR receptor-like serine/threonine-protein kinase FLS2 n=1 Tax=Telopea speciosissima TaxID=54955 RepID=UPI001CC4F476|nr:LRR receptor-like serine/threonine-protein kinase FLS2 [Telopea speciosissima]